MPAWEAEVVTDEGGGAGLAADRLALQQQRAQPLGGAIGRGGQPGRPGADHGDVVAAEGGLGLDPECLGEPVVGRVDQDPPVEQQQHRRPGRLQPGLGEQPPAILAVGVVEPVGDAVAGQQVTELVGAWRPARADDPDQLRRRSEAAGGPWPTG